MGIPDLITSPSRTPQVITTDNVAEFVNSWPADLAREVFVHSENLLRFIVAVAAAGGAEGLRIQFRYATNAALTGTPLVIAETRILLPAVLTVNSVHFLRINPHALPVGYDFSGVYYDVVNSAFSGGFALQAALVDGAEKIDPVDATP